MLWVLNYKHEAQIIENNHINALINVVDVKFFNDNGKITIQNENEVMFLNLTSEYKFYETLSK